MPKSDNPRFPGGKKVLYCDICSVPPEYCEHMDSPAECEEWLQARHPKVHAELQARKLRLAEERVTAVAAEKAEAEMEAAMAAEAAGGDGDMDPDEAAMLAAMEEEMADGVGGDGGGGGGGGADAGATAAPSGGADDPDGDGDGAEDAGEGEKKKKKRKTRRGGANNRRQTGKTAGADVQEVVLSRVQRNKRKFVTVVMGLETFGHKLKTAAKKLGKRFACGAAVSNNDQGKDEIVIQGDCLSDLPKLLSEKFEVPISTMWVLAKGRKVLLNDLRVS